MIGVGVEAGEMSVRLLDPVPTEESRPDLQKQLWDAHTEVVEARVNSGIQLRLHGDSAPETLTAWTRYEDALRGFSNLIRQV